MANPFFDAAYYLAQNPDVAEAGFTLATAEQHYDLYGAAELRAPNQWFDATAYLAAYPDLAANGVAAATAFYHYITYGIDEDRSPAINVNPADFTYTDYAASNPDLQTAFGITDPADLTVVQQHELLAHFLAYGFHENRGGVDSSTPGSFFAPPVTPPTTPPPGMIINVNPTGTYPGGEGNDTFIGIAVNLDGSTLDGKGGDDTLQATLDTDVSLHVSRIEHIEATVIPGSVPALNVIGTGVSSVTIDGGATPLPFAYTGDKVDSFTLNSSMNVTAIFNAPTISGTSDGLQINMGDAINGTFSIDNIEHFGVAFGSGNSGLALIADASLANSSSVGATLTGGHANDSISFTFGANPAALQTVTIDGSAVVGNLSVTLDFTSGVNTSLSGGSGNDTLVAITDASHHTTLNGGAGNDALTASVGQDIMTGGSGSDTFDFINGGGVGSDATGIVNVDSIEDFEATDILLASPGVLLGRTLAWGSVNEGFVTFDAAPATLQDAIASLDALIDGTFQPARAQFLFEFSNEIYFLSATQVGATDTLVKLTGVTDIHNLSLSSFGVHNNSPA